MKTILCYGDSLTWGYDAEGLRHPFDVRWPNRLAAGLGEGFRVIAEGLNGRTTMFDDHSVMEDRNGARTLPVFLGSHQPLDLVVIMLGTNDFKRFAGGGYASSSRQGMARLVEIVKTYPFWTEFGRPETLVIAPPALTETSDPKCREMLGHAIDESRRLAQLYREVAEEAGCHFFDAGNVCATTAVDGIHLDTENTCRLGDALVPVVRHILH
ncbi:SGNH/GDSL hydrolase family protein [Consotaella salsifontis]|uniref:Lysophospholipase L1 n=1 Tax=Consotaella salsifontis TaxID=1365950 RepID=A0A1T4T086_9HYPH|nr:SGNH/GDSL hydrolase family protein [Consotaella salsifontis]SKA33817.1 Lysophospholipase L1 [Consotaella salsifontis]